MPLLLLAIFSLTAQPSDFLTFQGDQAVISLTNPRPGEVLKGIIQILGTVQAEQFGRYEVSFAYAGDPTGTWFLIAEGSQPVQDGLIASWDTSQITDGDYRLRVLVTLAGGSTREWIIPDLRVRNYTPIEPTETRPADNTAAPQVSALMSEPTIPASTDTPAAPLTNSGSLTEKEFLRTLGCGASASLLLFLIFGLYLALASRARRR